eukprot:1954669-Rhodomonas_salina.2
MPEDERSFQVEAVRTLKRWGVKAQQLWDEHAMPMLQRMQVLILFRFASHVPDLRPQTQSLSKFSIEEPILLLRVATHNSRRVAAVFHAHLFS